jgi:flavin reductase (DIM6/NTAB) family NADH-FMN oxidoreductase RutF
VTWDRFHDIAADLDYPMLIVTAAADDERAGCLVGFATQCSIDPVQFLVWLSKKNHTCRVAMRSPLLNVHFPSSTDRALAELFGGETGDSVDKFSRCRWREGTSGVPVLSDCARWFSGRVLDRVGGNGRADHTGFVLEPVDGAVGPWPGPLRLQQVLDIDPGHEA